MAFSLTSIDPTIIPADGGYLLEISGTFVMGHRYRVYVGDTGSIADPICYSGVRGQANDVYPVNVSLLRAYSPRMASDASAYTVLVIDVDTLEAHILASALTADKPQFYSTVFAVRAVQPPHYKTGPRSIDSVEEL